MKSIQALSLAAILAVTALGSLRAQELSTDEIIRRLGGVPAAQAPTAASTDASADKPKTRGFAQHAAVPTPPEPEKPKYVIAEMTVHFGKGSSTLSPDSYPQLQKLAQALKTGLAGMRIGIVGRTDASGSDDFNLKLSRDRAIEVTNYLIKQGSVDPQLLYVQGLGKGQSSANDQAGDGRVVEIQRLN